MAKDHGRSAHYTKVCLRQHKSGAGTHNTSANAFHFLCIHGIGDTKQMQIETFEVELQRRHFWSWYIMHCHSNESFGVLEAAGNIENLPLPWPEHEFAAGSLCSQPTILKSTEGSTSIFAELVKLMTFW
jgi:hypothetical protein